MVIEKGTMKTLDHGSMNTNFDPTMHFRQLRLFDQYQIV